MAKTKKKSSFNYTPLTRQQLKKRETQQGGFYDSIIKPDFQTWSAKKGKNNIRFMPPTWENYDHFGYDVWVHRNIGPDNASYLCRFKHLGEECSLCNEAREMAQDDIDASKEIRAKKSVAAWIIDRSDEEAGPLVWIYGYTVDQDITSRLSDKRTGEPIDIIHPEEGYDVSFTRTGEKRQTKYTGIEVDRQTSPLGEDEDEQQDWLDLIVENPIPEILQFYDNEYMVKVLSGKSSKKKDEDDEDEEEDTTRRSRGRGGRDTPPARAGRGRGRPKIEDDEDEDDEPDEDEDEEEETPRRGRGRTHTEKPARGRRSPPPDDDEDEDEDDEDDEEEDTPPRGRRRPNKEAEKPARGRRGRQPEPEEDDEDEDDEDEEEAPPPRGRRKRPTEIEEELDDENPSKRSGKGRTTAPAKGKRPTLEDEDEDEDDEPEVVSKAKRALGNLKKTETSGNRRAAPPPARSSRSRR